MKNEFWKKREEKVEKDKNMEESKKEMTLLSGM